tara:strand:+ start:1582 stop:2934 length:1353 start_codon:yes stop_codon:yes gene_type:complete
VAQPAIFDGDTGSYTSMSDFRSLGYPIFLKILKLLGFGYKGVSWVQAILYAISTAVLVRVLAIRIGLLTSAGVAAGLLLNPYLTRYQFTILTEGLWLSVLLVWAATLIELLYAKKGILPKAVVLGALTGLAFTIKPASIAMVPILVITPILMHRLIAVKLVVGATVLSVLAFFFIAGMERSAHHLIHGSTEKSQLSNLIFARSLMLEDHRVSVNSRYPKLTEALEEEYKKVHFFLREVSDIRVRQFLNVRYEAISHFGYRPAEFYSTVKRTGEKPDTIIREFGIDRILANKTNFFVRGLEHFLGMWTIFRVSTPGGSAALQAFLDRSGPLPLAHLDPALRPKIRASFSAFLLQFGFWATGGLLSFQMLLLGTQCLFARRLSRVSLLNLTMIITIQGSFLAIAMLNTAIERFSIVYLPLIYVALALTATQYFEFFLKRGKASHTPRGCPVP